MQGSDGVVMCLCLAFMYQVYTSLFYDKTLRTYTLLMTSNYADKYLEASECPKVRQLTEDK